MECKLSRTDTVIQFNALAFSNFSPKIAENMIAITPNTTTEF